jgi:hypothetical protein
MALRTTICLLDVLKKDFGEVVEAMFQGVEGHTDFLNSEHRKKRLG